MPICAWLKDGSKLEAKKNTNISFKDGIASLIIKKADAECAGIYKLIVENASGKQEGEVKVQIKGS